MYTYNFKTTNGKIITEKTENPTLEEAIRLKINSDIYPANIYGHAENIYICECIRTAEENNKPEEVFRIIWIDDCPYIYYNFINPKTYILNSKNDVLCIPAYSIS